MSALTPSQIQTIKSTIPVLQEHGNAITTHFYATLLAEKPTLKNIFNLANQRNNQQPAALASSLYAYASHIDDLGALSPAVEKICHKHASLYIRPEQYEIVGTYLLRAMGDVLGKALTPEILAAWEAAYWQLAKVLIGREEELYADAENWRDWREFRIARKEKESEEITSFYFEPVDGEQTLPDFLPGQYISVKTEVPELGYAQARQYSLSDAPNGTHYRISVKREAGLSLDNPEDLAHPGCISSLLHDKKNVGDVVQVSHPYGEFFLDPAKTEGKPIVLLSAGVGLTPMVSIVNTLVKRGAKQPISFVHGSRSPAARAFYDHVTDEAAQHSNVQYTTFIKNLADVRNGESAQCTFKGRLSLDMLDSEKHLFLDDSGTQYFVCGPEGFMVDMEAGLAARGVDQSRIHLEVFGTGMPTK